MQLEGSRSGSSLSLQRGLQPPSSSSHRNAAGGGAESGGTGASSVHRSTSSANPTAPSQKPSRRHSQDTHGTMHASATAATGELCCRHCFCTVALYYSAVLSLFLLTRYTKVDAGCC